MKYFISLILLSSFVFAQSDTLAGVDSTTAKIPTRALMYSFVPGGGQLYNKRPLKALLFAGAFTYFGSEYVIAQQDFESDPSSSDLHRTRNDKVWLMALTWTLNIIDAYVDAQLWDFEKYPIEEDNIPDLEIVKPKKMEDINEDQ